MDNIETKTIINKKNLVIMIVTILMVIIVGTYAWLSYRSNDTAMVLTVGEIEGMSVTLKPYQIDATLTPVSTYTSGITIDVTANNKKSSSDKFKLYYQIDTIDDELIDANFKYTITKSTNSGSTYTIIKNGNFSSATSSSTLEIYQEEVPGNNTTYLYKVYLWIDSTGSNQASMQGKTFNGELRASFNSPNLLYDVITENAVMDNTSSTYVSSATGIDFSQYSSDTNGKGLYIRNGTENNTYPVHYFRGAVTNNNILFGGFCWKIVRTTETGGVKIVFNGNLTGGSCGTGPGSQANSIIDDNWGTIFNEYDFEDERQVSYMDYSDEEELSDSVVKSEIDQWFSDNLVSYNTSLEDTIWCNDRQKQDEYTFMPSYRYTNSTPNLTCQNKNDAFTVADVVNGNGNLTYPVAMLTIDEIMLAGLGNPNASKSTTYYLESTNIWWTMSPAIFDDYMRVFSILGNGSAYEESADESSPHSRPAISLKHTINYLSGDGTVNSPYQVSYD